MSSMIDVTVSNVAKELGRRVEDLAKQTQFAMARGLTWLASEALRDAKAAMDKQFDIRRKWVKSGISFTPAWKRDWPESRAVVGVLPDRAIFLEKHLTEGEKQPPKGHSWAVPARAMKSKAMRPGDKRWPGAMLSSGRAFLIGLAGKSKRGVALVKGRGSSAAEIMQWFLPRTIKIRKTWGFHGDVDGSVQRHWHETITRSFKLALETAR